MVGIAITGSKFVIPYGAIFLAQAGVQNPFLNNCILALCTWAGSVFGPWIVENGGRRFAKLTGYGLMGLFMLIVSTSLVFVVLPHCQKRI